MNLHFLRYNNYLNRIVKRTKDYTPYLLKTMYNVNFNPHDGVSTTQQLVLDVESLGEPDYMVEERDGVIHSRWFVMDTARNKAGQYTITLKRDTIADYYDDVMDATTFVERGTLKSINDPALFNKEGFQVNQIKTAEAPLKDYTGCPWIVGYIAKNADTTELENLEFPVSDVIDYNGIINWPFKEYYDAGKQLLNHSHFRFEGQVEDLRKLWRYKLSYYPSTDEYSVNVIHETASTGATALNENFFNPDNISAAEKTTLRNYQLDSNKVFIDEDLFEQALRDNGKIIKDGNSYYRIETTITTVNTKSNVDPNSSYAVAFSSGMYGVIKNPGNTNVSYFNKGYFGIAYQGQALSFSLVPVNRSEADKLGKLSIDPNSIGHLDDSPYDMFCMPYMDGKLVRGETTLELTKQQQLQIGSGLNCNDIIYDIQLLPYCPISNLIIDEGSITIPSTVNTSDILYKANDDDKGIVVSVIMWAQQSEGTITIRAPQEVAAKELLAHRRTTALGYKTTNELDMWRLCSPNYNGVFEFNYAKNKGVSYYRVDYAYKPYTPYIHVSPLFKNTGLYGGMYNDNRGLICGGDFSLPKTTDAWANYELTNKNYMKSFERQIETMEVQHKWDKRSNIINSIAGGIGGVMGGAMVGGPIGGVAMGAAGIGEGIYNAIESEALHKEQLSSMRDQFNYNLQNIQALPMGLSKVSALNPNNKIYPFIEYYTCTDEEREWVKENLNYNGWTIMRVGNISNFIDGFVKGRIIRMSEKFTGDFHALSDINNELSKGVYIYAD